MTARGLMTCGQDYFQLLRSLDAAESSLPRLGRRPDIDARRLRVAQRADFGFASHEVSRVRPDEDDVLAVQVRHFGMFAPYGPLPIAMTESAREDITVNSNDFEDFCNLLVNRPAILLYRAWSQLHPAVACDRPDDDAFGARSAQICGATSGPVATSAAQARRAYPGCYIRRTSNLADLEAILASALAVPIRVVPRAAGWIDLPSVPSARHRAARLGRARLGRRFYDAQHRALIEIGPLANPDYLHWQEGGARLAQLMALVADFSTHRLETSIHLRIVTTTAMAMRIGGCQLGRSSWLAPVDTIHTQTLR